MALRLSTKEKARRKAAGVWIKQERERRDMPRKELAELAGISQPYLDLIERGKGRTEKAVFALNLCSSAEGGIAILKRIVKESVDDNRYGDAIAVLRDLQKLEG